MFLRKNRKSANGEGYKYWITTLGRLSEQDLAAVWEDIEALLEVRKPASRQLLL